LIRIERGDRGAQGNVRQDDAFCPRTPQVRCESASLRAGAQRALSWTTPPLEPCMFALPPTLPAAIPDAVISEKIRYYTIEGRNESELVAQMNAKGYLSEQGRFWGYTLPHLDWRFDSKAVDGRCHLTHAKVAVVITTTLPAWTPPAGTSAALLAKWRAFDRAIRHHEGEHAQIDRDGAAALVASMRKHSGDVSCAALDAALQAEGKAIIRKGEDANRELDERTQHGAKEGVAISW
jgi:predicted secreted Zn-dependent protease